MRRRHFLAATAAGLAPPSLHPADRPRLPGPHWTTANVTRVGDPAARGAAQRMFDAPTLDAQKAICRDMQLQCMADVPSIPGRPVRDGDHFIGRK